MDFKAYLIKQTEKHKSVRPEDIVKMCYQAAFGASHLLTDMEADARRYFYKEYDSVVPADDDEPLYEEISENFIRVNLRAWKASGMPAEWLFNMFVAAISMSEEALHGRKDTFCSYLEEAGNVVSSAGLSFGLEEWEKFIADYMNAGIRAIHHSEAYRDAEKPAYRVINAKFINVLPILRKMNALTAEKQVNVIAIDGRAAAGKTTMAGLIKVALGAAADIIHMDDFFLPPYLRSSERYEEPGGNVHYERFMEEVLPDISCKAAFEYRIFDCSIMDYNGKRKIGTSKWRIVEGSYAHHPKFGDYADVKIFLDVEPKEQMRRIMERNGEEMAQKFKELWIPLEEKYIVTVQPYRSGF